MKTIKIRKASKSASAHKTVDKSAMKASKPAMPEMPAMSENMYAEMQKMMGEMMRKDLMDTSMYLMQNAVIEDGKMYTPITHTYIGWFNGMMGWCDSQGYRLLIEEVNQKKQAAQVSDVQDTNYEFEISMPDDYFPCDGQCDECRHYHDCMED